MQSEIQSPKFTGNISESLIRNLARVWIDFESKLNQVPIIDKINRGKCRLEDYQTLLLNLRQQIVDGSCWISRMCSNISMENFYWRTFLLEHALYGHKDYLLAEKDYVNTGGDLATIEQFPKNIGSEALSAFIFQRASEKNALDLVGAMFIVEGLSSRVCAKWAKKLKANLGLRDDQLQFLLQHSKHQDEDITGPIENLLQRVNLTEELKNRIVRTARITARLYLLQLEELEFLEN